MSVVDRVRARAEAHRDALAVVDGEARWSYAELFDRVDRLSAVLARLGLEPGEAVMAWLPNAHEAIEAELAALDSGLVWITLTARLSFLEVCGVGRSCAPRVLITSPEGLSAIAREWSTAAAPEAAARWLPATILVTRQAQVQPQAVWQAEGPAPLPCRIVSYEAQLAATGPARSAYTPRDEDVARLRYTSGTTGEAKAAVLPHRVYEASLDNLLEQLGPMTGADCVLHAAPLTHGSGALLYPVLWAGGRNVLMGHYDTAEVLELIERYRVSLIFTVPTITSRLVREPDFERRNLSSLRALIYGGAPMAEPQLREAVGKIGRAMFHIYGMTEAPWPITALGQEEHRLDNPRLRSIGRSTSVCELRVVDAEGRPVATGSVGELQIRGRNVMQGYFRDPLGTRAVLNDGWLSSGDLGYQDEAGYFFLVDRKKDVIISGGFNVYATEVEAALCELEGVAEAAVIGVPDPEWGEKVCAIVVARPGAGLVTADLDNYCRRRLAGYKRPRRIDFADELPKTSTGKISKSELRERYSSSSVSPQDGQ